MRVSDCNARSKLEGKGQSQIKYMGVAGVNGTEDYLADVCEERTWLTGNTWFNKRISTNIRE